MILKRFCILEHFGLGLGCLTGKVLCRYYKIWEAPKPGFNYFTEEILNLYLLHRQLRNLFLLSLELITATASRIGFLPVRRVTREVNRQGNLQHGSSSLEYLLSGLMKLHFNSIIMTCILPSGPGIPLHETERSLLKRVFLFPFWWAGLSHWQLKGSWLGKHPSGTWRPGYLTIKYLNARACGSKKTFFPFLYCNSCLQRALLSLFTLCLSFHEWNTLTQSGFNRKSLPYSNLLNVNSLEPSNGVSTYTFRHVCRIIQPRKNEIYNMIWEIISALLGNDTRPSSNIYLLA